MKKNVPELRLKGFEEEWKQNKLSDYVERVIRKNKENVTNRPLTISAQYGLVDQEEFFNKVVASKNLEGYYLLNNGEFAYNKSYSNGYPFGAIKRLDKYKEGAVSTLYICFKPQENTSSTFLTQYFECSKWHKEVSMIAVEGARNHGLLNIAVSDFFETLHVFPSLQEQEKIADFFTILDDLIEEQDGKVKDLETYKKGMMQKIFSQEIRFKDENGCDYPEWEEKKLGDVCNIYGRIGFRGYTIEDIVSKNEGVISLSPSNIVNSKLFLQRDNTYISRNKYDESPEIKVFNNDIIFVKTGSSLGKVALVENLVENATINPQLIVVKNISVNSKLLSEIMDSVAIKKQIAESMGGGTIPTLTQKDILMYEIRVPKIREEEEKIAKLLSDLDNLIEEEKKNLDDLREMKKGLLQQMFV